MILKLIFKKDCMCCGPNLAPNAVPRRVHINPVENLQI